jgi:hypothetical protein
MSSRKSIDRRSHQRRSYKSEAQDCPSGLQRWEVQIEAEESFLPSVATEAGYHWILDAAFE